MKQFKIKGKETIYLYPFAPNLRDSTMVYPFEADAIKHIVPQDVTCGNYRIGKLLSNGQRFAPFYIGRVTEESLSDRLLDHISEFGTDDIYFDFAPASSTLDAYKQECRDYHSFIDAASYLRNKIHPAKPKGMTTMCPICGD